MKRILFLAAGPWGAHAVEQFGKAAGLFRSSFDVSAKDPAAVTDADIASAKLIAFDDAVKARFPHAEVWPIKELEPLVRGLGAQELAIDLSGRVSALDIHRTADGPLISGLLSSR